MEQIVWNFGDKNLQTRLNSPWKFSIQFTTNFSYETTSQLFPFTSLLPLSLTASVPVQDTLVDVWREFVQIHVYLQAKWCPWSEKDLGRDSNCATITSVLWISDVKLNKDEESGDIIGVDMNEGEGSKGLVYCKVKLGDWNVRDWILFSKVFEKSHSVWYRSAKGRWIAFVEVCITKKKMFKTGSLWHVDVVKHLARMTSENILIWQTS